LRHEPAYTIGGIKVVNDDDLEAIKEAYKKAAKLEWSEEREAFNLLMIGPARQRIID